LDRPNHACEEAASEEMDGDELILAVVGTGSGIRYNQGSQL